jgi:drug/metabolite transporter (DMT)-like permease
MIHSSSKRRFPIQYVVAALIAFAGSAVLLKGIAIPLGTPGPGPLSYVVAALLILTGALLVVMAATELVHPRGPFDGSADAVKQRRR